MTDDDRIRELDRAYAAGDPSVLPRLALAWWRLGSRRPEAPLAVQLLWLSKAYRDDILSPGIVQSFLPEDDVASKDVRFYASIQRWPDLIEARHATRSMEPRKFVVCKFTAFSPAAVLRGLLERWHGPFESGRKKGPDAGCRRCLGTGLNTEAWTCSCAGGTSGDGSISGGTSGDGGISAIIGFGGLS